jgi:cellulose synthase/poly-beta-1,6-N-acetylglucosamine synthase-like glycosyltransferase
MLALLVGALGVVGYVFAGYPALAAVLARLRPRPVHADRSFTPHVSLVITAHNEEAVIEDRLRNVAELDYPRDRLEVIVVADGSDDRTAERAAQPGVRVLHDPERRGKLAAMNRGASVATGEVLLFSDANNHYTPATLRELVAPLADPSVGLVTGRKVIDAGDGRSLDRAEGLYWRYESKLKEWESAAGSVVGVAGEILAFRRDAYRSPEEPMLTEDFVQATLVAMAGWRVVYAPQALSVERASATIEDEAVRRARIVTGRSQAMRRLLPELLLRHPVLAWRAISHKALRPLVPWALLATAASNAALARSRPWARVLASLQASFYALAVAGWRDERRGRRRTLTYLPFYFCRMNLAALRGVRDFATGSYGASWTRVRRG